MTATMTIGDFSRATGLSAKALRLYHQEDLLVPVQVDAATGYRRYAVEQIPRAQVIRRMRSIEMPLDVVRQLLSVSSVPERNDVLASHLAAREADLERARTAVATLRDLLTAPRPDIAISHRSVPAMLAVVVRGTIDRTDLGRWYTGAADELAAAAGLVRTVGPRGGIWGTGLFLHEHGEGAMFLPVADGTPLGPVLGRARVERLPATDLAVATHRGTDETVAEVYAALGEHVARRGIGTDGPIRETYLQGGDQHGGDDPVTEIGWPVLPTG